MGICRFILVKAASFHDENWRFWSGLRDLNPRSLGPKPSAIPNFAKPGYSVGVFSDVVKHVVKGYFRPEQGRSQEEKALEPQRVFGSAPFCGAVGAPAPKPGALPTGPHPDIYFCATHPMDILYHPRQIVNGNFCSECGNYTPHPHRMQSATFFSCEKRSILSECLSSIAVPAARRS